jgi:N-acetylneuraminic acid mutarotase
VRVLRFAVLVALFSAVGVPADSQNGMPAGVWTTKAALPAAHSEVGVTTVNGKIYIVGGTVDLGTMALPLNEEYDPASNRTRERSPLPRPLSHVGLVGLNGKVYVVGGFSDLQADHTGAVDSLFVYDPATDTWRTLAPMKEPRGSVGATVAHGKIYAIGGRGLDLKTVATNEVYDPASNRWTELAPLPKARDHLAAVTVDDKIHIVGGRFGSSRDLTGLHDVYDPATDTWSSAPPLPTARSSVAAAVYHGLIVVDGGECNNGAIFNQNEGYDVKTQRWIALTSMPIGLHGFGAAAVGSTLYFVGGANECGGGAAKVSATIFAFNLPQ